MSRSRRGGRTEGTIMPTSPRQYDDHPTVTNRRRLLALAGPLAGAALAAGSLIGPRAADTVSSDKHETAKILAAAAGQRTAVTWAGLLLMVGLLLLIPFFAGVTATIRDRGARLATIGATLAMIGAGFGALSQWFFFSEYQLTAPGVPAGPAAAALASLPGFAAALLFLGFMGGLAIGWLLLCIAAWRSRLFSWWQLAPFALAWLAVLVSHSAYSAVVVAAAGVALAPAIASSSEAVAERNPLAPA